MLHLPRKQRRAEIAIAAVALCLLSSASAESRTRSAAITPGDGTLRRVTAVRFWSLGDVTRIAIEADGDFTFHSDRVPNPDRLFFDLPDTKPNLDRRGLNIIPVHDRFLKQIRIAETQHGVTRVVLDLENGSEFSTETLANPDRLVIELHTAGTASRKGALEAYDAAPGMVSPAVERRSIIESVRPPAPARAARTFTPPPVRLARASTPLLDTPPALALAAAPVRSSAVFRAKLEQPYVPAPPLAIRIVPGRSARRDSIDSGLTPVKRTPAPELETAQPRRSAIAMISRADRATAEADATMSRRTTPSDVSYPARRTSEGERSMIRVLGLKVQRIVIDAGHGGHDAGTIGPTGLLEKDLVLDVAKRLGALIETRLGSEVIYTRPDDRFIPLEERTAIANASKADLFLSIHANSSPVRSATGVETYYLNFTTSKTALEVAARENAGSAMTVNDLEDLLQKIALKDKVDESREFASSIQDALCSSVRTRSRDRGVRKAPFVVLIGASMPSVLAEIGFISNTQDERLLKRPEQRQKIAESLYKGLSQYAATLSHFQVAEHKTSAAAAH